MTGKKAIKSIKDLLSILRCEMPEEISCIEQELFIVDILSNIISIKVSEDAQERYYIDINHFNESVNQELLALAKDLLEKRKEK